eukprot:815452_1
MSIPFTNTSSIHSYSARSIKGATYFLHLRKQLQINTERMSVNADSNDIEDLINTTNTLSRTDSGSVITETLESCDANKKPKIDDDLQNAYIPNKKLDDKNRNLSQLSTLDGGIPGSHSVYVKTWGCSHNWSDSEYMAGILIQNGYKVTFDEEEAIECNIWILNSCTVKGRAQNLFESALKKAKSLKKYVVSAGCVPSGDKHNKLWSDVSIIGVQQIGNIHYVVQQTLAGNIVRLLRDKKVQINEAKQRRKAGGAPLSMPKLRRNKLEEIVPINTGCLNHCTYCKTKHARGDLGSYDIDEIVQRIRSVLLEGEVRIINLESEDTGAYGIDLGTNIAELLEQIEVQILNDASLSRNMMLRLGISNPPYFLSHARAVSKILAHPRVFTYIHIPVQSGSNRVLYDMKRKYTVQEFEELCDIMMKELDGDVHICTDIIAGFPTETDECWNKTMDLVEKWKFSTMYISPFFARPGTPAASFEYVFADNQMDINRCKKERVRQMTQLCQTFEPFKKRLNSTQFWICHQGRARDGIHFVGLNKYAEKILVKLPEELDDVDLSGKILHVHVFQCGKKYMYATVGDEYRKLLKKHPNHINYVQLKQELNAQIHGKLYIVTTLCVAILISFFFVM